MNGLITPAQGIRLRAAINRFRAQYGLPPIDSNAVWVDDAVMIIDKIIELELRVHALEEMGRAKYS